MNKEQRKQHVLDFLLEKSPNKNLHYNKIKYHLNSKDKEKVYTAPINPKYLEIDNTPIIITESVYESLQIIDEYNLNKKKEVPFIIYGNRTKGGAIYLDDLYCNFDKLKDSSANLDKLEDFLFARLNVYLQDNMTQRVIVLGHTHPFTGKVSFNYSLSDLCFHMFYYEYNVFCTQKYGNLLLSLVKTITQDYNFIIYDPISQTFKTFNKVYRQTKKKEFIPLSSLNYCDD